MTCPNCTSLKADYTTLSARFDRVLAERDKWHAEYDNLAKFATQYETERDAAVSQLSAVQDELADAITERNAAEARAEELRHERDREREASNRIHAETMRRFGETQRDRDRLAEALRALWDEDAFGPHPALTNTHEPEQKL
jgi:chromosome segregation ATPase